MAKLTASSQVVTVTGQESATGLSPDSLGKANCAFWSGRLDGDTRYRWALCRIGATGRANAVGRSHVEFAFEVFLKRYPFVVHIHFPAPGADLDKTFQNAQSPKNPERGRDHRGRDQQYCDRFEPKLLRPKRRLARAEKSERHVQIFIEPKNGKEDGKSDHLDGEDYFFVGMRLSDFYDVASSPRTALAIVSYQSS
jgi:hypothetical protein